LEFGEEKYESTKKTLIVAVWSINTQGMQQASLALRMKVLKECAERAYDLAKAQLRKHGLGLNDKPFALFVAPEYLVANPDLSGGHSPGSRRHIEEGVKVNLLQQLQAISNSCQGMIMIPGTVAWRKPFERTGAKLTSTKGPNMGQLKPISRYDKALSRVQFYADRQNLGPNARLSNQLSTGQLAPTTGEKLAAINQAKANALINSFFGYGPNDLQYMAQNTAYVLLDGQVKFKYNKQGDFHEVLDGTSTVHIPGKLDGRFQIKPTTAKQRPILFGLEVCLDHVFQTTGKEIPHVGKVDVHIITSAQVREQASNLAVFDHGVLVHACSNKNYSGVKRPGRFWGTNPEKPFHSEDFSNFPLQLWEIEIELSHEVPTSPEKKELEAFLRL
jgi:hypothetical protein